ncbi:MAG: GNAT family N-acetyltransferase [Chloroflexota bacterium]|nr:GNAT family N-acetyltransferase [Chloroflexota bacterium]
MLPIADDDDLLSPLPIATPRLELTAFTLRAMRATLGADLATAAHEIDAEVPADLRERLGELFEMRTIQVLTDPASLAWLARAMVMVDPATGRRRMVGSVGFHAPPSGEPPHVEVGYHVEPAFRRQGLATEAVGAMLEWAAGQGIHRFRASVAPTNAASLATIARFGFVQVGVHWDPVDGEEFVYETDWPPPDAGPA